MSKKFFIHYCPGSGGMFLTSVFAKIMNTSIETKISSVGDCHDYGNGIWTHLYQNIGTSDIFDTKSAKLKLQDTLPDLLLYYGHAITKEFAEQNTDINLIQIYADQSDYFNIAKIVIKKACPNLLTKEEYDKWRGVDYPPYSRKNIAESDLICKDLLDYSILKQTSGWYEEYADIKYLHHIDFKTVMGLNDKNLAQEVATITGNPVNHNACKFINEYQQLNKRLYFD